MPLQFAPLCWIYHDGWKFKETKMLEGETDTNGNPVMIDASQTWHQCGHCHLFMEGVAGQRAHWGSQEYRFHITDEWGPNSGDPSQNRSVRLLGRPIWYFHVDEYWRRVYIQPWDEVDMACRLPLNQEQPMARISQYSWMEEKIMSDERLRQEYGQELEQAVTDILLVSWFKSLDPAVQQEIRDSSGEQEDIPDPWWIIHYANESEEAYASWEEFSRKNRQGAENSADQAAIMIKVLGQEGSMPPGAVPSGQPGELLVPQGDPVGHVGIRYDASAPAHSLGPFREGGSMYFFGTAVNRTLPCEYWLDADRRARQLHVRRSWPGEETRGDGAWTLPSEQDHFTWVADVFEEAHPYVGTVNSDAWVNGYYYKPHRLPQWSGRDIWGYAVMPPNAKRLRTDLRNDRVTRPDYDLAGYDRAMRDWQDAEAARPGGHYGESGWIEDPGETPPDRPAPEPPDTWERGSWSGWYEWRETVRCAGDGRWYVRQWKPQQYDPGVFTDEDHPLTHWTKERRQDFPNPDPRDCDDPLRDWPEQPPERESAKPGDPESRFVLLDHPFGDWEQDRLHRLRREYFAYYGMVRCTRPLPAAWQAPDQWDIWLVTDRDGQREVARRHGQTPPADQSPEFLRSVPGTWDAALAEWEADEGPVSNGDDEQACMDWLLAALPTEGHPRRFRETLETPPGDPNGAPCLRVPDDGPTCVTFQEFRTVWRRLSDQEIEAMGLQGDMPARNGVPYRMCGQDTPPTLQQVYPAVTPGQGITQEDADQENEFKRRAYDRMIASLQDDRPCSLLCSEFWPRTDTIVRDENERRAKLRLRPYGLSPFDEIEHPDPNLDPLFPDPWRNGSVNPIDAWKKHFTRRDTLTLPESTAAAGDAATDVPENTPNGPGSHPREMSYSHEDGARRTYPDKWFQTPVIEYQKVTQLDWERLPGNEDDEQYLQAHWQDDPNPSWGDGTDIAVSIPFRINGQPQSPFSYPGQPVQPPGTYCNPRVRPEDMLRYHAEFYDSPEQLRKYDPVAYVQFIREFQKNHQDYHEDFGNPDRTAETRRQTTHEGSTDTWQDAIDQFWNRIDGRTEHPDNPELWKYSNTPVTSDLDSSGNHRKINTFADPKTSRPGTSIPDPPMWIEDTTRMFPDHSRFPTVNVNGTPVPGYLDSRGNYRKGADVAAWNNPYGENLDDGRWVEQCLGAVVRARCVMILEDRFGFRWKQVAEQTAMTPDNPIRGSDYDIPEDNLQ